MNGRLAEHAAAGRKALAAHAAWQVVNAAEAKRPEDAERVAEIAQSLWLIEPHLLLRRARKLAESGDYEQAIELANAGLRYRKGSTDLAWQELLRFRDGLAARQCASQRVRPVRQYLVGRSAPAERPQRRRFTRA